jgi:hypothetical protein
VPRLRSGLFVLGLLTCAFWFASGEQSAAQKDTAPVKDTTKDAPPKDGPTPKGTLPANWKKLGLTADQVKQVYKVQDTYHTKIDALKQQIDDLKKAEKGELEKVLTPAQKDRLREIILGEAPKDGAAPKDAVKDKAPVKDAVPKDAPPKDKK